MSNLSVTEIKAFVPAKDFAASKRFYEELGFTMASDDDGIAYFHLGQASFLLHDFCAPGLAEHTSMHLLVADVDAWRHHVDACGIVARFGVDCTAVQTQPWRMREFCLTDPSGVVWRIAQNVA